jgi:putative NADH-flavin reductase
VRITVFGATGRTGRLIIEQAVERDDRVTAFIRDASRQWFPDAVRVKQGDPHDPEAVGEALLGSDAAIAAYGPVAGVTTDEISRATQTVVDVMQRSGPRRFVLAGNSSVFTDDEVAGPFANVAAEHRRDLSIVRSTSLDWTMLAPELLRDEKVTGEFEFILDGPAPGPSIARADLATALILAIEEPAWAGHAVGVSS